MIFFFRGITTCKCNCNWSISLSKSFIVIVANTFYPWFLVVLSPWRVLYMLPIHILHPAIKFEFVFLFCLGALSKNKAAYKHHHKLWRTEEGVIWRRRKLFSSQGTQFMTKSGFEIMKCFHFFFSLSGRAFVVWASKRREAVVQQ